MALEKCNVSKAEHNNLTGAASAVRRTRPKKITNTTGAPDEVARNVETDIYQKVIHDYLGENGVVTQLFGMELKQRADKQAQQWDLKEKEFYDLKADWIQNVSYLKEVGTKRWENMAQEFGAKWKDWRADFKAEHEANQALFLNKIEQAVQKKETWTQNFLLQSQNNAEEQSLREMYDSIAGVVQSMQENLPQGVSLSINVNDILASVLAKKPGSLSASLMDRASSIDTNFFLNEVKKYNFNDKGVKDQFKSLMEKTNVLSQNMVILQALESLRNMPESFVLAVKKQNEATQKSLDSTMAFGGFARMGAMYLRVIKNAAGGTEQQVLPVYNDFVYTPPTEFPLVKDSNGNEWDLSKTESLLDGKSNAPSPSDIGVMVRLAKNKMLNDFKKTLDNDAPHNYELESGLIDPEEAIGAFNDFTGSVMEGDSVACMNKSYEECSQAALGSMTLVGEVPGGAYGLWQFGQFYPILKTKKEMDKRKAMMDASRSRRKTGMGRLYGQLGAFGTGIGQMLESGSKAALKFYTANMRLLSGDVNGAKKDAKDMSKEGEKVLQGALYAVSGFVDFLGTVVEIMTDVVLNGLSFNLLNNDNTGLEGKYAEFNYELEKYRGSNAYQRDLNRKGKMNQSFLQENEKNISTAMTLGGEGGLYDGLKGAYEGGGRGLLAKGAEAGANSFLAQASGGTVSINLGYNYNTGYSAGINVGPKMGEIGVAVTVGYTEKTGMNVGAGIRGPGGFNVMYMEGHTLDSHGRVIETHGWNVGFGGVNINHDSYSGYGMSITASGSFAEGGFAGALSLTFGYNERNGFSTSADVDLEMIQGTRTWNQSKYDEIRNRQSSSSPFGNSPWDVVNNHFQNVFNGFAEAWKGNKFTNPLSGLFGGNKNSNNAIPENDLDAEYADMEEQMFSMMDGATIADANGMPSSPPSKATLAKIARFKEELDAYDVFKSGNMSKSEFEAKLYEARKKYYIQTQGERSKITVGKNGQNESYTDISSENLEELLRYEAREKAVGRLILSPDGKTVYFRTAYSGLNSESVSMNPVKISEKPWTKVDPHTNPKYPGWVDLHAPIDSGTSIFKADDNKFQITGLTVGSEGGNMLQFKYTLNGNVVEGYFGHLQNKFPSYVIDELKKGNKPVFDTGTVVGWVGATGQRGVANLDTNVGVMRWYNPAQHTHVGFSKPNKTDWRDWGLPGLGY
ncbi:hypothetical protein [Leptospira gomenensis]|uniref:hypothetical protein n=1 Tax=Leptospira gomenensis TaxID=2484974 RepID=UPI001102279F|nr:hypothetical protein [Leptospira gomenensis]TGK41923.1 hypothetical protein EHQ07_15345 [Leptospira gomenensis]